MKNVDPERVKAALKLLEEDYPDVTKWVRGSVAHLRAKYGGLIGAAIAGCAILEFVVGV